MVDLGETLDRGGGTDDQVDGRIVSHFVVGPASGRIAVKVIDHLGDEVMKVFRV